MFDSNDIPQPPSDSGDEPQIGGGQSPNDPAADDAPLSQRIGRNPSNLGDEVADEGDITFPDPAPLPAEMPAEI